MGKLGLAMTYAQYVAKYGKENAGYIIETLGDWRKNYSKILYLEMGTCDERQFIEVSRQEAQTHNWQFEQRKGDWSLLEKLFLAGGQETWDDDFVIVPPGGQIAARNDDAVLEAK
jgi:hypothetical protein